LELGTYGFIYSSDGESSSTSDIGLAPAFGFDYELTEKLDLNGNLKYNYVLTKDNDYSENTSILGFNIGVTYKF
jgi:opacity protein-like surface antigen